MANTPIHSSRFRRHGTWLFTVVALFCVSVAGTCWAEVQVPEGEARRAAVSRPAPVLSPLARQMKLVGRVEVQLHVNEAGSVDSAKLVSGNPVLGNDVLATVKHWKFAPFAQGGAPAAAVTTLSFEFR